MEGDMNFDVSKAIQYFQKVLTEHYADFQGRVGRRDFWTYVAVYVAIAIIAGVLQSVIGLGLMSLVQLALLLPTAGITARRLQDTGQNGSLVWILMIPLLISSVVTFLTAVTFSAVALLLPLLSLMWLISLISLGAAVYLIYLCLQPGTPGTNQYGPEPAMAV
jgi:uncharacterized membrane protein YhaH (DUF805 family)